MTVTLPPHLSHSQLTGYSACGERHRLERLLKVPTRPAWALIGGGAFHRATEEVDHALLAGNPMEEPYITDFSELLEQEKNEVLARTDGFAEEDIRASGRASKAWPDKENRQWWEFNGPVMVGKWIDFVQVAPWDLWVTPDGEPAIEVEVNPQYGEAKVKGFIDRIFQMRDTGDLIIVDLKSGATKPKSPQQLGQYASDIRKKYGVEVWGGAYYDARSGITSEVYDLSRYTEEFFAYQYESVKRAREAGIFLPVVADHCGWCQVKDHCYGVGGARSNEVPRPWEMKFE